MKPAPHLPQRIMSVLNIREPTGFPLIFWQESKGGHRGFKSNAQIKHSTTAQNTEGLQLMSHNQITYLYINTFPFCNTKPLGMPWLCLIATYAITYAQQKEENQTALFSDALSSSANCPLPHSRFRVRLAIPLRATDLTTSNPNLRCFSSTKEHTAYRALAHPAERLLNLVRKGHLDYLTKNRSSELRGRKTGWIASHIISLHLGNILYLWKSGVSRRFLLLLAAQRWTWGSTLSMGKISPRLPIYRWFGKIGSHC